MTRWKKRFTNIHHQHFQKENSFSWLRKFLILWKGYLKSTWEPSENLDDCALLLDSFYK
ncbi:hypothetical protein C2G38_2068466 [Gigaspora rosea]|uniref:Chromo domain-containing protein n=1 Tax=Gigaspora rosea TaxID=44941 RepID=A0A397VUJ4_9GLOM|nr:hypothetical protein C2G38_2068466 [Gigaspora rosea]